MIDPAHILFAIIAGNKGNIGLITLNRPQALNAINLAMTLALYQQLKQWEVDPDIKAVIIQGAGGKAFCAGGDIKAIYDYKQKTGAAFTEFFWHEYRLNYYIANYTKPYIALMDGITMGGGAGLSVHGRYRIATEKTLFAMPETSIGFFPDVGGSYFLSRCPGNTGIYLALTSTRIQAADTQYLGLTDYYIHSAKLTDLMQALAEQADIASFTEIFNNFNISTGEPVLKKYRPLIDKCFNFNSIEAILNALQENKSAWHKETAELLLAKSPTSLKLTLEELHRGAKLDLTECLKMEYRIVNHLLKMHDFYEGIRASVIDKNYQPKWQPQKSIDIKTSDIKTYFDGLSNNKDLLL